MPEAPVSGGSMTTASVAPAVQAACLRLREQLVKPATTSAGTPLYRAPADDVVSENGWLRRRSDPSKREAITADVKAEVLDKVKGSKPWGVDVVDVRITRADYVDAITESVYRRMEAERKRVANELRSTGAAEGEKIRADADRQREVAIANAYRDAQKIKGEGDAEAARIYAEAFGRDPQFAQFYRSLDAYKASFSKKSDVMVVDPSSSEFFKVFRGSVSATPPKK